MEKKLIPNSTQIPNIILDFLLPQLSEAEGRCLLYIARRTYGFHKEEDRISFSQFIKGIKNKDDEILDYGAGLSRPSVNEALSNLRKSNLILVEKSTKGNYYSINLELFGDKEWRSQVKQVVRKINQLRKLTKIGKASRPKQVKLPNLQKKGNKGNKVFMKDFKKLKNEKRVIPIGDPPKIDRKKLKKLKLLKAPLLKKTEMVNPKERAKIQEEVGVGIRSSGRL